MERRNELAEERRSISDKMDKVEDEMMSATGLELSILVTHKYILESYAQILGARITMINNRL